MDRENGRRLNTNANVSDDKGEKPTPPFFIANSDRSSTSSRTVTSHGGNGSSPAKISDFSHNVPLRVEAPSRSAESAVNSPESAKRSSDIARDSFVLTESPVIQVMERPKTSDPNTVDDSPNRWSVDSNDSLFSLRMGNESFTNGHSLRMSGEMHGIGELSLSEAYLPRVSSPHRSESRNSPSVKAIDETRKDVKEDPKPGYKEPNLDPPEASISIHTDSNLSQSSDPHASNDDNKSRTESLPSPSRKESSCPMCRYSCCNKMDGCCRWPSCSCCRWPSCSSWFKWPNCSNICSSCPSCCSCCSKCHCSISFSSCCCCCCFGWKLEPKRVRSVSSYALMDRNVASSSKHNI